MDVPGYPEFVMGEPVSLEEMRRIDRLARRNQSISAGAGGTSIFSGDGGIAVAGGTQPRPGFWARLTVSHGDGTYDFVQMQWAGSTYLDLDSGLSSDDGFIAREVNEVETLPADPVTGPVVKLSLADDGESWEFTAPASSGGTSDHKVSVSSGDTTSGFLAAKIVDNGSVGAGTSITVTDLNPGGSETLGLAGVLTHNYIRRAALYGGA